MPDLTEAAALVEKIEADLAKADTAIASLIDQKALPALAAARGDARAGRQLSDLNERLWRAEQHKADLATALVQAKAEQAELEAAGQLERDRARADELEAAQEEMMCASRAVDLAMATLAEAFRRRDEVAERLFRLAPTLRRDAGLRLVGEGAATRAARACGLHRHMKLPWSGDARHEVGLVDNLPIPEIEQLIAELRGLPPKQKSEAA